jgi:hypothetical protein
MEIDKINPYPIDNTVVDKSRTNADDAEKIVETSENAEITGNGEVNPDRGVDLFA